MLPILLTKHDTAVDVAAAALADAYSAAAPSLTPMHPVTVGAMSNDARTTLANKRADRQRQAALLNPGELPPT